jgi:hypothetical protein
MAFFDQATAIGISRDTSKSRNESSDLFVLQLLLLHLKFAYRILLDHPFSTFPLFYI